MTPHCAQAFIVRRGTVIAVRNLLVNMQNFDFVESVGWWSGAFDVFAFGVGSLVALNWIDVRYIDKVVLTNLAQV